MKRDREFDDILNECIERVLKGETIESCMASFPEHSAELEPLLRTAITTWNATEIQPRPEFRQRAANDFQAAIRDLKTRRTGTFVWQVRLVTVLSVIVVILMAGTSTVAAASNSQPDEPLYGVKLFTEDVRVALTPSATSKAELYAQFADTRVSEIIKMADEGKAAEVEKATEQMNSNLTAIARLTQPTAYAEAAGSEATVLNAAPEAASKQDMKEASTKATNAADVKGTPTPTTTPTTTSDASLTPPPQAVLRSTTPPATPVPPSQTPPPAQKATPATAAAREQATSANATRPANNEKSELENTMSRQAAKNTDDLKEALKRVPDNVKPSVEKALDAAGKGYEEALKNISRRK